MDDPVEERQESLSPSKWVDRHGDYLYRYALSRLRDAEASEEVVQETFVAGLRNVDQYAGTGTERAWLLGILKRKIVDHVRLRSRASSMEADGSDEFSESLFDHRGFWKVDPRIFGSDPSAPLEKQEFWMAFRKCLNALPGRQADAFTLREMDDKSSEEICKDLEISPSNLWVLLHRARLRLANCMKTRWQAEGGQSP
jgi:RNA polymerase sigma-70 factor (ECF subfamily)